MRMIATLGLCMAVAALAACGDRAQTAGQKKADAEPFQGANPAYTAGTWKAGDAAAWEAQIKTRAQGQNEYSRSAP